MAFATMSGPLRTGTVKEGAGENTGVVTLARTTAITFGAMTTSPTAQQICTLPAGTKIIRFVVEVITAISGGSVTNVGVTIGDSGTANKYVTTFNTGLTSARVTQATVDAAQVVAQTNNLGTADVAIFGTFTAAGGNPTAGQIAITIAYMQRAADGAQVPASA